ncbi:uncharacterized protein LOC130761035 [Actinidia eriantha]|uniref:uncharacterized protein LOC130761035 n=1 Tax=Actinidia eriantha TaxID=165200 RepID=UPI00258A0F98|nr:uncharacterized protein LOC130761035 [Actinidia eriantha]
MGLQHRAPLVVHGGGRESLPSGWLGSLGGCGRGQLGGFSHESEHDLGSLVRDFIENGSCGNESWYSSDSDSGSSDLAHLADKILLYKHSVDQYESDLVSVVHSIMLSIDETNYPFDKSDLCNASCIRFSLVKLLQSSGYDAAICTTKWQSVGKIPGGEHEFIDVINHFNDGCSERYIIDIDFNSHFEIARAVQSYDAVLRALPPVFVGSMSKLKQFLQAMEEAARASLKQNSMPLPPWRSLAYLQAKWESTSGRVVSPHEQSTKQIHSSDHQHCSELLTRLKSRVESEIRGGIVKPWKNDGKQKLKPERWRNSSFRTC